MKKEFNSVAKTKPAKRPPPFSIWMSPEEKQEIKYRADRAGVSMGGYCKSVLFNAPLPRKARVPSVDQKALSQLLGQVGVVGNNVNQIARQLNMESAVDLVQLDNALQDIADLRAAILKALGYREDDHEGDLK